jgi:uncharacterized membrane protein
MASDTTKLSAERPRASRWLRIALFASLTLNALFVGGLVSAFLRHGGPMSLAAGGGQNNNIGAYLVTLPAERRGAIWKATGDKRRTLMPLRRELRTARRDMLATLSAEPFDKAAFVAAQTRLIEAEHRQRLAQRDLLLEVVGSLSPDERQSYVRWRGPVRTPSGDEDEMPTRK